MEVKIKICGITCVADAISVIQAEADYIGLIFYNQGPRYVDIPTAKIITNMVGNQLKLVGLFVDPCQE